MDNIQVFMDTEKKYETIYKEITKDLIDNHTYVYVNHIKDVNAVINPYMSISVVNDGTVNAGKKLREQFNEKTAILNFANAVTPGGLLLVGASTQEENICRCSNLYASLTSNKASIYYDINRASNNGIYTDSLIYSEYVLFYKDDKTYEDIKPYRLDVITCPAPSVSWNDIVKEYSTLYDRIEQIIKSAILHNVKNIVLGAWGCGAFGQNPRVVAKCFKEVLKEYSAFNNVVFAIRSCADDYNDSNFGVFKEILEND